MFSSMFCSLPCSGPQERLVSSDSAPVAAEFCRRFPKLWLCGHNTLRSSPPQFAWVETLRQEETMMQVRLPTYIIVSSSSAVGLTVQRGKTTVASIEALLVVIVAGAHHECVVFLVDFLTHRSRLVTRPLVFFMKGWFSLPTIQAYFFSFHAAIPIWCGWWISSSSNHSSVWARAVVCIRFSVIFGILFFFGEVALFRGDTELRSCPMWLPLHASRKGTTEFCGTNVRFSRVCLGRAIYDKRMSNVIQALSLTWKIVWSGLWYHLTILLTKEPSVRWEFDSLSRPVLYFTSKTDGETTSQVGFDCNRKISMCMGLLKGVQSAFGCRPIEMDQGGNTVKSAWHECRTNWEDARHATSV